MSLYERIRDSQAEERTSEALKAVRRRVHQKVIADLGVGGADAVAGEDLRKRVTALLQQGLREETTPLTAAEKVRLVQ